MPLLSFDEIRAKVQAEQATVDVTVPSLGGDVRLTKLGAQQKISLGIRYQSYQRTADGKKLANPEDLAEFQVLLVAATAVNASGKLLFDGEVGRRVLNMLDPNDLVMLANEASSLNGMDKDDPVEDAKKNLSNVPTGSLPLSCVDSLEDSRTPTTSCPT